ncbi:MAG: hypothetical protein Q9165_007518 [Trypethelium subeluteriae]
MPERAHVFADAMKWHATLPAFSIHHLVDSFPWGTGIDLTIVDVGGGFGHVSRALIDSKTSVKCIVQDALEVVKQGSSNVPDCLQGRIMFQAHDFFQKQPFANADVYLLRLVLHDWSDKYAKMIIQALIPALKPGARIVVNDRVVPERCQTDYLAEREARDYDMYMLAFQNAKKRTANDWKALFADADPRFQLTRMEVQRDDQEDLQNGNEGN